MKFEADGHNIEAAALLEAIAKVLKEHKQLRVLETGKDYFTAGDIEEAELLPTSPRATGLPEPAVISLSISFSPNQASKIEALLWEAFKDADPRGYDEWRGKA